MDKERNVSKVVRYLYDRKAEWMQDDKIVDGRNSMLLVEKMMTDHMEIQLNWTDYIQKLCEDKVYSKIEKKQGIKSSGRTKLPDNTSCMVYDGFLLDVLYTQLPKLLNEFVKRSLQEKNSESEEAMKDYKIFISYSEDSENTINRIKRFRISETKRIYSLVLR